MSAETKKKLSDTTVVTGPFRMSFPSLLTPKVNPETGKAKFELVMIYDPNSPTIPELKAAMKAAMIEKFGTDTTKWPKNMRNPIRVGDDMDAKYAGSCGGKLVVSASNYNQPGLVDAQCKPVIDKNQVYPGRWAVACVRAYYYDQKGNKGVTFNLEHVQLRENDTRFDNRPRVEDVFSKVETTASTQAEDDDDAMFS